MHNKINIAIDGPAASGKSAAGALFAKKINYNFMDTGILYRSFTFWCLKQKFSFDDEVFLETKLNEFEIKWVNNHFICDNQPISEEIYNSEVTSFVTKIASIVKIRKIMVAKIQTIVAKKGFVVVGRDITSVVIPDAEIKIFLTSSLETRSKRRYEQYWKEGKYLTQEQVKKDMALRDKADETRSTGQLLLVDNAVIIDSSNLDLVETVEKLMHLYHNYGKNKS